MKKTVYDLMRKAFFLSFTSGFVLLFIAWSFSDKPLPNRAFGYETNDSLLLQPEPIHIKKAILVSNIVSYNHYTRRRLNDSISSEMFNGYIKALDDDKLYFLASDINKFEKYRLELDDYVQKGNINIAYDIYNVYKMRLLNRIDKALKLIAEGDYDFEKKEYYDSDREEAAWAKDESTLDEIWRKIIKNQLLSLKIADKSLEEAREILQKRYERYRKNISQTNSEDVFQIYMNALTQVYDPHTNYFSPISSENFKMNMSKSFEGIGARLTMENDYTKVVEIIPGGPAAKSKELQANDRIIGVAQGEENFEDVVGWRLDDVVALIRGKKGSLVRLKILPADGGENATARIVKLTRDKITIEDQSATKQIISYEKDGKNYKVGVIDIPSFYMDFEAYRNGDPNYKSTSRDVRQLITELEKEGIDGLVIDLRDNGGGSLQEAIQLTGLFIDRGAVVQVRDHKAEVEVYQDEEAGTSYNGNLVVLVNGFSASASEIFAGAIQDYNRGVIVGEQTFGKGTVQNPVSLNRYMPDAEDNLGQINITLSKFYRVTGSSTQNIGVTPDIKLPAVYNQEEVGERSEPSALPWDKIRQARYKPTDRVSARLRQNLQQEYEKRQKSDPYLRELIASIKDLRELRNNRRVSLNEAERKAQMEAYDEKRKKREQLLAKDPSQQEKEDEENKDLYLRNAMEVLIEMLLFQS